VAWIELQLLVDRDTAPLIEAALETAGALAVTLDDGTDGHPPERSASKAGDDVLEPAPGATPLWRRLRIKALFNDDADGNSRASASATALAAQCLEPPALHRLDDQPWERTWLQGLEPRRFGTRLWVCPRGQRVEATDSTIIELDPGLAFGTGHHATTALCLEWLDAAPLTGTTLLDFGCGSGILAIAALKLGARRAIAVDHDPQALEATRENARVNAVSEQLTVCEPGGIEGHADVADVLVANILAGPLIDLAPHLVQLTRPAGALALSGILADQAETVTAAYRGEFEMDAPTQRDEWVLIAGRRRS
jgi:ribosomal protein L11 methyltransferase